MIVTALGDTEPGSIIKWTGIIVALLFLVGASRTLSIWLKAHFSGLNWTLLDVIKMRLMKLDPQEFAGDYARAVSAGLKLKPKDIMDHACAGGNVKRTLAAAANASAAGLRISWKHLANVDLSDQRVDDFVEKAVASGENTFPDSEPEQNVDGEWDYLIGKVSRTKGYVYPAGTIELDGQAMMTICEETPLADGVPVEVIDVVTCLVVRVTTKVPQEKQRPMTGRAFGPPELKG